MGGHLPDDPEAEWADADPPDLQVEDTLNPVVATLLGPSGDAIFHVLERPRLALGFHPGPRKPTRIERVE